MEEMTELEDLQCPPEASTKSNLQLSKVDRYYNGPVPQTTQVKYRSSEDMLHAANLLVHEVSMTGLPLFIIGNRREWWVVEVGGL